ncbi:Cys-tRNA(Pro) deacylase [Georgenia sp. TF02-10]|uniref:Cys-tRNA(Pro) deacylase n=1 Tax=Georgenia sp. TF02-10 TaxID=2917725 RepID=UPI001FA7A73F|nr:Cys-tRNA(Pro) deacylase [Georgenia sp. TF02-10]UNX53891.1 Cys-tRNA(Pro) deacylase [Georgenia sp. TF02-10]
MSRPRRTASTPALKVLAGAGVPYTVRAYDHDPRAGVGYGQEAVAALGEDPRRVYKTLLASVDGQLTVAVVPVDHQLDLRKLARALGAKHAEMADPAAAERATGYVRGGISPLGQRTALPTVVDAGALEHPTVLVSAGRRGLDVELAPTDLVALTGASTAPLGRP